MNTVGNVAKHTDVSLWCVAKGDYCKKCSFDKKEFETVYWYNLADIPYEKTDRNMKRFVDKLKKVFINNGVDTSTRIYL